jgi:hypothetical protein
MELSLPLFRKRDLIQGMLTFRVIYRECYLPFTASQCLLDVRYDFNPLHHSHVPNFEINV